MIIGSDHEEVHQAVTEAQDESGAVLGVAAECVALLTQGGQRLAVAESLTGGLLADAFVQVPGASAVLSGGVVAYDTRMKQQLLDVSRKLLEAGGPVQEGVAAQMASGVRQLFALPAEGFDGAKQPADFGLATTGVAGPSPDAQSGAAPGTVFVSVSWQDETMVRLFELRGTREQIRRDTVHNLLLLFRDVLLSE